MNKKAPAGKMRGLANGTKIYDNESKKNMLNANIYLTLPRKWLSNWYGC